MKKVFLQLISQRTSTLPFQDIPRNSTKKNLVTLYTYEKDLHTKTSLSHGGKYEKWK